jgi:hypothetical protein
MSPQEPTWYEKFYAFPIVLAMLFILWPFLLWCAFSRDDNPAPHGLALVGQIIVTLLLGWGGFIGLLVLIGTLKV